MLLPVIMAGGTGSRLWPMSRELYPKQFLRLYGQNSMLQETISRLSGLDTHEPMVICNEEHRFLVAEQLRQLGKLSKNIILEPVGRNTAPAIALAALQATQNGDDPLMLVLAADHIINNQQVFHDAIRVAEQYAQADHLVTFGIVPNTPETGYGYIQRGNALGEGEHTPYQVARFVEKPDLERAQAYLASGDYYWNSGMFMFRAKKYLSELAKFRPDILEVCTAAVRAADSGSDFISIPHEVFSTCPDESVDYAVMEKTADAVVVGLDGERPARLDGDTVNVEARRLDHHVTAAPRTVDFAVSFVFAALVGLQVLHDLFHVLGTIFIHHQYRILGADDHQVLNADSRHQLFVAVDVAVLAVVHPGIAVQHVAKLIFGADIPQG